MSMNGITGYSTYTYTNPYAVPNYNGTQTTFQETTQTYTNQAKEENNTGLLIAGIGAAALAVGTGIYALKKGKAINGADGKFLDNLKTGFQKIGETISEKFGKILKQESKIVDKSCPDKEIVASAEEIAKKSRVPHSEEALDRAIQAHKDLYAQRAQEIAANAEANTTITGTSYDLLFATK